MVALGDGVAEEDYFLGLRGDRRTGRGQDHAAAVRSELQARDPQVVGRADPTIDLEWGLGKIDDRVVIAGAERGREHDVRAVVRGVGEGSGHRCG